MNKKFTNLAVAAGLLMTSGAGIVAGNASAMLYSMSNTKTPLVITKVDPRNNEISFLLDNSDGEERTLRAVNIFYGDISSDDFENVEWEIPEGVSKVVSYTERDDNWEAVPAGTQITMNSASSIRDNPTGMMKYAVVYDDSDGNEWADQGVINYNRCISDSSYLSMPAVVVCRAEVWDNGMVYYQPYWGWKRLAADDEVSGDSAVKIVTKEIKLYGYETVVEKEVEVEVEVEKIVEVPVEVEVEVEKIVEVEKVVEVPVEVEKIVEVPVEVPVLQTEIKEVEKWIEVPMEVEKIVEVEKTVEVPVEVTKVETVTVEVPVEKTVVDVREVVKEVPVTTLAVATGTGASASTGAGTATDAGTDTIEKTTEKTAEVDEEEPVEQEPEYATETEVEVPVLSKSTDGDLIEKIVSFAAGVGLAVVGGLVALGIRKKTA